MLKDMVVAHNWRERLSGWLRRFQGSGGRIHNPLGSGPGRASRLLPRAGEALDEPHPTWG
jgi:hypothetical protein